MSPSIWLLIVSKISSLCRQKKAVRLRLRSLQGWLIKGRNSQWWRHISRLFAQLPQKNTTSWRIPWLACFVNFPLNSKNTKISPTKRPCGSGCANHRNWRDAVLPAHLKTPRQSGITARSPRTNYSRFYNQSLYNFTKSAVRCQK